MALASVVKQLTVQYTNIRVRSKLGCKSCFFPQTHLYVVHLFIVHLLSVCASLCVYVFLNAVFYCDN